MTIGTRIVTGKPPAIGLPVKLKRGQLLLSARQIQYIQKVKKLEVGEDGIDTYDHLVEEGGYWIKTSHTGGDWWAWSLFRVA